MSMPITALAALPALGSLAAVAASTERFTGAGRGDRIGFWLRRCDVDSIPGIQELVDLGYRVKVHSGLRILTARQGKWTERKATLCRQNVLVEVEVG